MLETVQKQDLLHNVIFQSFDTNVLNELKLRDANIKISYLTKGGTIEDNLSQLTFAPDIYSPHYKDVNEDLVKLIQNQNMKIIPWTVNKRKYIRELIDFGVDGVISDYPQKVLRQF